MFLGKQMCGAAMIAFGVTAAHAADSEGLKIVRDGNSTGASACSACHGMNGAGMAAAGFPRLAGQNADYLAKQLHDMQQNLRSDPVMQPMAKALNDQEIIAVAKYYAGQAVTASRKSADSADLLKQGELLATIGNWSKGVPACFKCHGEQGAGIGLHFPAIAPQSATYLANQLHNWKKGSRHNDPQALMKTVADHLSDEDIAAVSAYLASLGAR